MGMACSHTLHFSLGLFMKQRNKKEHTSPKRLPLWGIFLLDLLALGICLIIFALFHHVLPRSTAGIVPVVIPNTTGSTPSETAVQPKDSSDESAALTEEAATITEETSAISSDAVTDDTLTEEEPEESFEEEVIPFADKFTDAIVMTEDHYSSPDICIDLSDYEITGETGYDQLHYFVADIYLRDAHCFQSYLAGNTFSLGGFAYDIETLAAETNAILAINGDYYSYQNGTLVLRNGILYRMPTVDNDICVLYNDGVMKTFRGNEIADEASLSQAIDNAWQVWSFGPALLKDGHVYEDLDEYCPGALSGQNPRTGLGYYEPGHYCFVVADGRTWGYSWGAEMNTFAQIFEDLGCTLAYNLDGGGSSTMYYGDGVYSNPCQTRTLPDCILITEYEGSVAQQNLEEMLSSGNEE